MKKPILVVSNDWHIDEKTLEVIPGLISQKIALANKLGVKNLVCAGDIFQSRKAQKESVLNCFKAILDEVHANKMMIYVIPGNHDKTDYSSYSSFLDPFSSHPALKLITETTKISFSFVECYFVPFFEEGLWLEEFNKVNEPYNILFSHIAVSGSVNNNRTKVDSTITPKIFKGKRVLLGHYHNYQDVTPNIHHLPSLQQNNFGEDTNKGFTVVYDDCSFDIVNSDFKKYVTYSIDIRDLEFKQKMNQYLDETKDSYIKVKITGPRSEIKGVDLDFYKASGIKIDTIFDELIVQGTEVIDLSDANTVLEHFSLFCQERDIDEITGLNYLNRVL